VINVETLFLSAFLRRSCVALPASCCVALLADVGEEELSVVVSDVKK
jgi:hypothetical protein